MIPDYIKAEEWDGNALEGEWLVSYKLDGVRVFSNGKRAFSRKGKPLYNMNHLLRKFADAEVYCGSLEATVSAVRTHNGRKVDLKEVYSLRPLDPRLVMGAITDPKPESIQRLMKLAVSRGYEGVVLRREGVWVKVKPLRTYDVIVRGIQPGKGKHLGRMGALITDMGKVGGGFDDWERERINESVIGCCIEVACQQLTPGGKFRSARFVRFREDK